MTVSPYGASWPTINPTQFASPGGFSGFAPFAASPLPQQVVQLLQALPQQLQQLQQLTYFQQQQFQQLQHTIQQVAYVVLHQVQQGGGFPFQTIPQLGQQIFPAPPNQVM